MKAGLLLAFLGQWVWTPSDVAVLRETAQVRPDVTAGIFAATIAYEDGALSVHRAMQPREGAVVVIRLDDSVHAAWDAGAMESLDALLAKTLANVRGEEILLDYDCPVRRLPEWSAALGGLHSLAGKHVWITTLPAHVRDPRFGELFRDRIAGHVLQLFDTGVAPDVAEADRLRERLAAHGIPFRIGVGAFERAGTDHLGWFALLPRFAREPAYDGAWIFPAGNPWLRYLPKESE